MLQQKRTIEEIARVRNLQISTIEGHICKLVETGEQYAKRWIDVLRYEQIDELLNLNPEIGLSEFKNQYPDYTWFEIKLVIADRNRTTNIKTF